MPLKIKKNFLLFLFIIISYFCTLNISHAKKLPPGTGIADIPANILLMLDTSGSMGWSASAIQSYVNFPTDVDVDSSGNVYILEYNYCRVKKFDSAGTLLKTWGGCGKTGSDKLYLPEAIAVNDSLNQIAIANTQGTSNGQGNVKIIDLNLNYVTEFNVEAYPIGIDWDSSNYIYITSYGTRQVHKYNTSGSKILDIGSGYGTSSGYMLVPAHVAVDSDGYIYVADHYNHYINKFNSSGTINTRWGGYGSSTGSFQYPWGIAVDSSNNVFTSEWGGHRIQKFNSTGTYSTSFGGLGTADGKLALPQGVSIDSNDKVYVADYWNHRVSQFTNTGTFAEHYGRGVTRIRIMKKVIRKILSDQSLAGKAHFGLMSWASSASMKVNVSSTGARDILNIIDTITTGGGTNLGAAMQLAKSYFQGSNSPQDQNAKDCQQNYLIVISDGVWYGGGTATNIARELHNNGNKPNISTFVIGFIGYSNTSNYESLAKAGGTTSPMYADSYEQLYKKFSDAIRQTYGTINLTYTAPGFKTEKDTSGNELDYIYQSTFEYVQKDQWKGRLIKKELIQETGLPKETSEWDAGEKLNNKDPDNRYIWTVGNGIEKSSDSPSTYNNFVTANIAYLHGPIFSGTGVSSSDGESFINFVRGYDIYDIDKDNNTAEQRWKLADIFHSELKIVNPPNVPSNEELEKIENSEAAYRKKWNYESFKSTNSSRKKIVLAGSNGGMLHAFDDASGEELWAFIPPSILPRLSEIKSDMSNQTNSISGVDGTPAIKDIFYDHNEDGTKTWRTIVLTGLGEGGKGYFALDITDTEKPSHLFTIDNDPSDKIVTFWNADGEKFEFAYTSAPLSQTGYDYSKLNNAISEPHILRMGIDGSDKWVVVFGNGYNVANPTTEHTGDETTTDYGLSFSINSTSDIVVTLDGTKTTDYSLVTNEKISFNSAPKSGVSIVIKYLIENAGVYVIDLEDGGDNNDNKGGKLIKYIALTDKTQKNREGSADEEIINSVPSKLTMLTADNISGAIPSAIYKGAMFYVADIEGKLWKIDMTGNTASFKKNILFDAEGDALNQRYSFHELEAAEYEEKLWLYFGTGNMENIGLVDNDDKKIKIQNRVYGIKDKNFPNFDEVDDASELQKLNDSYEQGDLSIKNCSNNGKDCPILEDQIGWYADINKDAAGKETKNEKVTGKAFIKDGKVLVPRYQPQIDTPCSAGKARAATYNYRCGEGVSGFTGTKSVLELGQGMLSKFTSFKGNIYASISGEAENKTYEEGVERAGNIIKITPSSESGTGTNILIESWRELF